MVPLDKPGMQDGVMMCHYALVVGGQVVGEAIGEQPYHPQNRRTSYATAKEAAKSDALVRIAKDLGVGWECWDPQFCREWKTRYAVQVWRANKGGMQWRRIDGEPFPDEAKPGRGSQDEYHRKPDYPEQAAEHLDSIAKEG